MNIEQTNILIDEFVGTVKALIGKTPFDRNFHCLITAVEKIESTKTFNVTFGQFYDDGTQKLTGEYYCKIINYNNDIVDVTGCSSRIEAVYKAVIEFIKWTNSIDLKL